MTPKTGNQKPQLLIVDDDKAFASAVQNSLKDTYDITWAEDAQEGMRHLSHPRDLVLLDYDLPNISGLEFLKIIKHRFSALPVIMLTGHSDPETVIETMRAGASDYVMKGQTEFEANLKFRIARTLDYSQTLKQNERLQKENSEFTEKNQKLKNKIANQQAQYEIVGASKEILKLKSDLLKLKNTSSYVIITGENGTGKELVARNLNIQEDEPSRPFVAINCAGIPANLFESEFFGHVKGAFTGAIDNKMGKFEVAHGGDIFLDEIGEIPLEMQAKLLRVLQEKCITPVGSNKTISINVRVIAATNRNLEQEVHLGRFREDLYYRLNQISLHVPSLRERTEDLEFLANHFLKKRLPMAYFSEDAMKKLLKHAWRGNIRELQNTIERACVYLKATRRPIIKPEHLTISPLRFAGIDVAGLPEDVIPISEEDISEESYNNSLIWMEKLYFDKCLELLSGDNAAVYTKINISKAHFFRRKKAIADLEEKTTVKT